MTLDEIKTQHAADKATGWRAHSSYDATAWLIAEVDRLTADVEACECSMLRQTAAFDAENDTLRAEVDRHTPASPNPDCHCGHPAHAGACLGTIPPCRCDHYRPEAKDANATG